MRKFLIAFCLLVGSIYLGRHVIIEKALEIVLERKTGEKLTYQSCTWEKEKLIYQELTLGGLLYLPYVEIQWVPFTIQFHVHLTAQDASLHQLVSLPIEGIASVDLDMIFKAADLSAVRGTVALSDVHWESEDLTLNIDALNSQIDFKGEIALDVKWEGADLFWNKLEILRSQGSLLFNPGQTPIFEAHGALNIDKLEGRTDVIGKGEIRSDGTLWLEGMADYVTALQTPTQIKFSYADDRITQALQAECSHLSPEVISLIPFSTVQKGTCDAKLTLLWDHYVCQKIQLDELFAQHLANDQLSLTSLEGSGTWNPQTQTLEQLTLQIQDAKGSYLGRPASDIQATVHIRNNQFEPSCAFGKWGEIPFSLELQGPPASFQAKINLAANPSTWISLPPQPDEPLAIMEATLHRKQDHLQVEGKLSCLEDTVQFQAEGHLFSEIWKGEFQASNLHPSFYAPLFISNLFIDGTLDVKGDFTRNSLNIETEGHDFFLSRPNTPTLHLNTCNLAYHVGEHSLTIENLSGKLSSLPLTSKRIHFQDGQWIFDVTLLTPEVISLQGEVSTLESGYSVALQEILTQGSLTLQCMQDGDHNLYEFQGTQLHYGSLDFKTVKATIRQKGSHWTLHEGLINDFKMQGAATQQGDQWIISRWDIVGKQFNTHLSGLYKAGKFDFQMESQIASRFGIAGQGLFDLLNFRIQDLSLKVQESGEALATLQCQELQYQEGKWTSPFVATTLSPWGVQAQLHLSFTPHTITFQGPFSQGLLTLGKSALQLKEIYGLYENSLLNLKCLGVHSGEPLQLTGKFTLEPSFEGSVQLTQSNLQFQGQLQKLPSGWTFQGHLKGHDFCLQDYLLQEIDAKVDYTPTEFRLKDLILRDPAGTCTIRKCYGSRATSQDPWQISIPLLKAQEIRLSALRKKGTSPQEPKPLVIRNLILADLTGQLGHPDSFQGHGSFNFSQHMKKDPSLFDVPLNFLKDLGLDLDLCTPVTGEVEIQLKSGKFFLTDLQNVFSEESRSSFFLAPDTSSFIDFDGRLSLHLRMRQSAALKLVEPFTITVEGTWEKPRYSLH